MSDLVSIGASGIRGYQRALSTVSSNISNAENPNYVRRDLRLGEVANTNGIDPYHNYQISFGGVDTQGIARASDPILEANSRITGAALYGAETRSRWASSTENALNDGEHGVGAKLNQLFAAGEELAAAPFDPILRTQFIADIDATVGVINRTATSLANISQQISLTAGREAAAINEALSALAKTNIGLRGASEGSIKQAALLDERDTALAVITERLDVDISFGDKGIAALSFDGQNLVTIGDVQNLSVITGATGLLQLNIDGVAVTAPAHGSLAGLFSSAQNNTQRRAELDNLAVGFATDLNAWNENGVTEAGTAGPALLSIGSTAASLTLATRNLADLALASSSGTSNGNIINLNGLRGAAGVEQAWTNTIGSQAVTVASAESEVSAAKSQHDAARQARDNLSSVDLDREAADLIRFQQAYDASARVIQVARETMQSIFAIF